MKRSVWAVVVGVLFVVSVTTGVDAVLLRHGARRAW